MKRTIYLGMALCLASAGGCASDDSSGIRQRQSDLLEDPYGYKPSQKKYDISGGGIADFDRDAFRKDMNSVFNP